LARGQIMQCAPTETAKAAEDSRTPRRCRDRLRAIPSGRSWSAAVLCRFDLRSLADGILRKIRAGPLVTSMPENFETSHVQSRKDSKISSAAALGFFAA